MREAAHVRDLQAHIPRQFVANREVQRVCVGCSDSVIQSPLDRQTRAGRRISKRKASCWCCRKVRGSISVNLWQGIETSETWRCVGTGNWGRYASGETVGTPSIKCVQ